MRKLFNDETRQPELTKQTLKYISTQSNKPHAFHEQIYIMQNAGSLEKGWKEGSDTICGRQSLVRLLFH